MNEVYPDGEAMALASVWARLRTVIPNVTRPHRKTGQPETVQEVRLVLRKKSGQWFASVGDVSRTGTSDVDVLESLTSALEARVADQLARAREARS